MTTRVEQDLEIIFLTFKPMSTIHLINNSVTLECAISLSLFKLINNTPVRYEKQNNSLCMSMHGDVNAYKLMAIYIQYNKQFVT